MVTLNRIRYFILSSTETKSRYFEDISDDRNVGTKLPSIKNKTEPKATNSSHC